MPSPPRHDTARIHLGLMLALTLNTGIVDAAGFLGLDRVFTGNITGSLAILGMALTGAQDLPVVGPVIAVISFILGALIAGRVLRPVAAGWTGRSTSLFATVGLLLAAIAVSTLITDRSPDGSHALAVTAVLGLAMGIQAATARNVAVKELNTLVITLTTAGLAADSRLAGRRSQPVARRVLSVLCLLAGAVVGAACWQLHLGFALVAASAVALAVSAVGHATARNPVDSVGIAAGDV